VAASGDKYHLYFLRKGEKRVLFLVYSWGVKKKAELLFIFERKSRLRLPAHELSLRGGERKKRGRLFRLCWGGKGEKIKQQRGEEERYLELLASKKKRKEIEKRGPKVPVTDAPIAPVQGRGEKVGGKNLRRCPL